MLTQIKNKWFKNDMYYVIGVSFFKNEESFYLLEIQYNNDELNIVKRSTYLALNLCLENITKDYPIILYVEGNEVLNKVVANKTAFRKELIFNADPEGFYFYELIQNNQIFASVTRKENIDKYVKQINDANQFVQYISIGPFVLFNVLFMFPEKTKISSDRYSLSIEDNNIVSFESATESTQDYVVDGESIKKRDLPLIASLFDFKHHNSSIEFDTSFLALNKSEYKYRKRFKATGYFALFSTLILLFISHNLQSKYQEDLAEKDSLYNVSVQMSAQLENLKQEKIIKESILQKSGINNSSFISKFLVEIGNSVTSDITLKSIKVMPLTKKVRENEEIRFFSNTLEIEGEVLNDDSFSNWNVVLKAMPWVKKVEIIDYNQENKRTNTFKIKIKV